MKKNLYYILALLLFSLLMSCEKIDLPPSGGTTKKKDISFLLNVKDITNKIVYDNKTLGNSGDQKSINNAVAVIVTVQDASNNILYNRKKLTINATDNGYFSSTISLNFGRYKITEFIVLDALDNAIFLSPKNGSLLASNVINPLPFSITVSASSNAIDMEVLSSFNLTVEDFGYTDLDFTPVGEFTFVSDQTNQLSMLIMNVDTYTDQYEYIIDWGDGTEDIYIPVSDLIHNYSEKGLYTVTVKGNIKALKVVTIFNNGLINIDFSKLKSLERILLISSQLTSLDVSSNKSLEYLSLIGSDNKITTIDLTANTLLKELSLGNNKLGHIDLSNSTQLKFLDLSQNYLTAIDLSNNLQLENLNLSSNLQLTSLDISSHNKLKNLSLNFMKQLNLDNIDLSIYPELQNLNLISDNIETIDLTKNTNLRGVWLWDNQITTIDLSENIDLLQFNLDNNQLTSLDLSLNDKLEIMHIRNNPIETLDISNNPILKAIYISDNQISNIVDMEAIYSQLLTNVKANNIVNGQIFSQNNNYVTSQALIDTANELINDFNWNVSY